MENRRIPLIPLSVHTILVESDAPSRIDQFLPRYFDGYSRSFFQKLIDKHHVKLNGQTVTKPALTLKQGDRLDIQIPPAALEVPKKLPDGLHIPIIYEHEHFFIIAKPASLMVHKPHQERTVFTLVDWLISQHAEFDSFQEKERPGIVHRLDKDTSGLMIIARNPYAQATISNLFKQRTIKKTYLALVQGRPEPEGTISYPINRDPLVPTKMTHRYAGGREAITHYKVREFFPHAALVEAYPVTGRTHQLRVHFASIGHPIIGDVIYGKGSKFIKRQALHAGKLAFTFEGREYEFQQDPPTDFLNAAQLLASNS
jgi:23S rRNA pseudouridine1911/1915/1917 synthase